MDAGNVGRMVGAVVSTPGSPYIGCMGTWATRGMTPRQKIDFHSKAAADGSGCRIWTAAVASGGYGQIWLNGRSALAHRAALELKLGRPILPNRDAAHLCHNRLCVNPDHLEEATRQKNIQDRTLSGRGARGSQVHGAKLREDQIPAIRLDRRPERFLSRLYGVSPNVIGEIRRGRLWKHVPDHHASAAKKAE